MNSREIREGIEQPQIDDAKDTGSKRPFSRLASVPAELADLALHGTGIPAIDPAEETGVQSHESVSAQEDVEYAPEEFRNCTEAILQLIDQDNDGYSIYRQQVYGKWRSPDSILCELLGLGKIKSDEWKFIDNTLIATGVLKQDSSKVINQMRKHRLSLDLKKLVTHVDEPFVTNEIIEKSLTILEGLKDEDDFESAGLEEPSEVPDLIKILQSRRGTKPGFGELKKESDNQIAEPVAPTEQEVFWQTADTEFLSDEDIKHLKQELGEENIKPQPYNFTGDKKTKYTLTDEEIGDLPPSLRLALVLTHQSIYQPRDRQPVIFLSWDELFVNLTRISGIEAREIGPILQKHIINKRITLSNVSGFSIGLNAIGHGYLIRSITEKWPDKKSNY